MGRLLAKNKITGHTTQGRVAIWWQSVGFGLPKVNHKGDFCRGKRLRADQAKAARLDQAAQEWRAFGDQDAGFVDKLGAIISDQCCAQRHKRQTKCGFARPRRAKDEQPAFRDHHAGGMHRIVWHLRGWH